MRKYGGWRPVKHAVGVWLTKVNTAWRTIAAYMASNARGIYPEQCARTQILHNGDIGWVSTEFLSEMKNEELRMKN